MIHKKPKFLPTEQIPDNLINQLKTEKKQIDARILLEIYQKITGENPVVWYPGIIGFGEYIYISTNGERHIAPLLAFAPRQAKISLYLAQHFNNRRKLLEKLGKHQETVGCIYINKLADINLEVLEELLVESLKYTIEKIDETQNDG